MPHSDPPTKKRPEPVGEDGYDDEPLPESDVSFESDGEIILTDAELRLGEPEIAAQLAATDDVEITTGEADIALDDLDLDEGEDPCPSPFERITVAPAVSEREYVAKMMREAPPSDPVPPSRARTPTPARPDPESGERISGLVPAQAKGEPSGSISSWPVLDDSDEPLTLDLADSVPPPAAESSSGAPPSIPPPPSLPGETATGIRERAVPSEPEEVRTAFAPSEPPVTEPPVSE